MTTTRDILGFAWRKAQEHPEEAKQIAGFAWDTAKRVYKRVYEREPRQEQRTQDVSTQVYEELIQQEIDKQFWNDLYADVHPRPSRRIPLDEHDAQFEEALRRSTIRDPDLTCYEVMEEDNNHFPEPPGGAHETDYIEDAIIRASFVDSD